MTKDLLKRLRGPAYTPPSNDWKLLNEAADEIERLRELIWLAHKRPSYWKHKVARAVEAMGKEMDNE